MREARSPSYFNPHEIDQVDRYLNMLLDDPVLGARQYLLYLYSDRPFNIYVGPEDIGVISPYSAQNKKLGMLDTVKRYSENLKTGTVEAFQAQVRQSLLVTLAKLTSRYDAGATYHSHVHGEELAGSNRF